MAIRDKADLVTPTLVILFIIAFFVSVLLGSLVEVGITFYVFILIVAVVALGISGLLNIVVFKIGTRNILRRKGYSVIVISGLMIGTIIISASLIIGDTMDNMITKVLYETYDETDITISGWDTDGSRTFISHDDYFEIKEQIMDIDNVEGVTGEIIESVVVVDVTSEQTEPSFRILGYNTTDTAFGSYKIKGKDVSPSIGANEVYIDEDSAGPLDASKGDTLMIITSTGQHFFTVKEIVDSGGRAGWAQGGAVLMPLESAQRILNVSYSINHIKVTNKGGVYEGEQYCEQVRGEIEELFEEPRYNLSYKSYNKVNLLANPMELNSFQENTYGNLPEGFTFPIPQNPMEMDMEALLMFDQYLNNTEQFIVFEENIDEETYSMLASDIAQSPYVDGITPELDLVSGDIGLLGVRTNPVFSEFYVNGTSTQIGYGDVYANSQAMLELGYTANSDIQVNIGGQTHTLTITGILDNGGRAVTKSAPYIFLNIDHLQELSGMEDGINIVRVSSQVVGAGGYDLDPEMALLMSYSMVDSHVKNVFDYSKYKSLDVQSDKASNIEQSLEGMSFFSDMFLVFGSFSIIAGVILIINIFVMLGEERKSEMGISRAVGMKRIHLKRSFVFEGSVYAVISAAVGAFMGIVVAYGVMLFMDQLFQRFADGGIDIDILGSFTFTPLSLVQAFTFGFLITVITVSFAAWRNSKLNIVRAIRNIPEPKVDKRSTLLFILGFGLFGFGLLGILLAFTVFEPIGWERIIIAWFYCMISLILIGAALVARRFIGDRWSFTIAALANLVFWLLPAGMLNLGDYPAEMEMFIFSGIFVVSSGVVAFVFNSSQILSVVVKLFSLTGRPTATLKTATSYPMKNKFRTGMTIYMFALIIFTITVMSMIVGMMSYNITKITDEQVGGIEIYGIANTNQVITNITEEIELNDNLSMDMFSNVYSVTTGYVQLNLSEQSPFTGEWIMRPMPVYGYDEDFASTNEWPFEKRMDGFDSDRELWEEVYRNPNLVILDGSLTQGQEFGPPGSGTGTNLKVGENVTFTGPNGELVNKTLAGFLKQYFINGAFMSRESTGNTFNLTQNGIFMFDLVDEDKADDMAKLIEKELKIETLVLTTLVKQITNVMEQFFNLFSAFMGLGLVVGIAGLGIIMLRAVHERRLEIGMMRAIGFKRKNVTFSFMMEASFIAIVGIILGVVLGLLIGWNIWYDGFRQIDFEFYIPWTRILIVPLIAYVATAVFTIPPAYSASKVEPAEALRFE